MPPSSGAMARYVAVAAAGSGDNTLIAAAGTGKKIRVLEAHLTMTGTAVTIRFESAASGTALTGQMTPLQGTSIHFPYSPVGHFETVANELLNLELGGAQAVAGYITYQIIG